MSNTYSIEIEELRRDIVIELSNAYYETYRYERPNDSTEQLAAFCRDLAENEVDSLIQKARKETMIRELAWCLRNPEKSIAARLNNLNKEGEQ